MRLYSSSEAFAGIAIRFHTTRDTPRASPRPARHAAPTRLTQHALGALWDAGREDNVLLAHFRALQCVTLEATAITSITAAILAILNHQHRTRTSLTPMRKPKCNLVGALLFVCRWRL